METPTIARCTFLPPRILRRIAEHGDGEQRTTALDTLAADSTIRLARATYQLLEGRGHQAALSAAPPQKQRTIYDAKNGATLPGTVTRVEGSKRSKDVAVNEAYDGLGSTWDFYYTVFQRNSIDGEGLHLDASVHYRTRYDNAFWDGHQMVFGDGDGRLFNRFTIALDVIGHELTHGVTGDEVGLIYMGQSGALNESISDVFGSLIKQYKLKQTADKADWLIGAGLLARGVKGMALRSMKAPGTAFDDPVLGKDEQPAHMRDYVQTADDNGGVHTNSGIPNHAFYLAAVAIGGNAWEHAGLIWYETVRDPRLRPTATFTQFARQSESNAVRLYGRDSREHTAVVEAWNQVGLGSGVGARRATPIKR
ncbi:MAG TPA: M4 family metallopeptidase [Chloroflexota bacterium]